MSIIIVSVDTRTVQYLVDAQYRHTLLWLNIVNGKILEMHDFIDTYRYRDSKEY